MPLIKNLDGIRIYIFYNDHEPPHLHCYEGGTVTVITLQGNIIRGKISKNKEKKAINWIKENNNMLVGKWNEIMAKKSR